MSVDPYAHDQLCHVDDPWGGVCSCGARARFEAAFQGPIQPTALTRGMIALRAIKASWLRRPRPAVDPAELAPASPITPS
jgi:hypothetical protein